MSTNYTPVKNGFAQENYYAQMGTALAGAIAFVSDINLVNSYTVDGASTTDGLEAGLVVGVDFSAADNFRVGINNMIVGPIKADSERMGVSVRNQQMASNADGKACWFDGSMATILDTSRVGGRVWCQLADAQAPTVGGAVYAVITASAGKKVGQLVTATGADAVAVVGAQFVSVADDGLVLVEFNV